MELLLTSIMKSFQMRFWRNLSRFSYCNDNIAAIITNSIHLVVGLLDTPDEEEQDFMVRATMALC